MHSNVVLLVITMYRSNWQYEEMLPRFTKSFIYSQDKELRCGYVILSLKCNHDKEKEH